MTLETCRVESSQNILRSNSLNKHIVEHAVLGEFLVCKEIKVP